MRSPLVKSCLPAFSLFCLAFIPCSIGWSAFPAPVKEPTNARAIFQTRSVVPADMIADILKYVNADRGKQGLAPLKLNEVESSIARKHSRDMANGKVPFGHSGLNARAKAIRKALGGISSVGENVASGPMNAREVVDGWLNSPGHKRNIEENFTLTGIGCARDGKGNIFFTQIFTR